MVVAFTLLYYFAFICYLLLGYCVLVWAPRTDSNRVFIVFCLCLATWAFSFGVANSVETFSAAMFWRRNASLGWGTAFAVFLHYVVLVTGYRRKLPRWAILANYLPAAFNVFVFGLYTPTARELYNLQWIHAGWRDVQGESALNDYFLIYYALCMAVIFALIARWIRLEKTRKPVRRRAIALLVATVVTFLAGTLNDMIFRPTQPFAYAPEITILLTLSIAGVLGYGILKNYLRQPPAWRGSGEVEILSDRYRHRVYVFAGVMAILGAIANVLFRVLFFGFPIFTEVLVNLVYVLFGAIVIALPRQRLANELREFILNAIICFSTPLLAMQYIHYANVTLWALPFFFLLLSVLFDHARSIALLAGTILSTQLLVWFIVPVKTTTVFYGDHIVRFLLFGMAAGLAFFVNRVFGQRLRENVEQTRFQKTVADISQAFSATNNEDIGSRIGGALRTIASYTRADTIYLCRLDEAGEVHLFTHYWNRSAKARSANRSIIPLNEVAFVYDLLKSKGQYQVFDVEKMDDAHFVLKQNLLENGARSFLTQPLYYEASVIGTITLEYGRTGVRLSPHQQQVLTLAADILSNALGKAKAEEEVYRLAYYDRLTGLMKHDLLMQNIKKDIERARAAKTHIGVYYIDLDGFKNINDVMGHTGGDELLVKVATALTEQIGDRGSVARISGDEFIVVVPELRTTPDEVEAIAREILELFRTPIRIRRQEFFVTAGIGVSQYPNDGADGEELIQYADMAMDEAKNIGRNNYVLCSPEMKREATMKTLLTANLYRAMERGELSLQYQPLVDIGSGKIAGVEALLRWHSTEFGSIPPSVFIPLAEQTGLINPIGLWVLETAARQNRSWNEAGYGPLRMSINLSVEQFQNPQFYERVQETLERIGIEPHLMELEVTESIIAQSGNSAIETLEQFKKAGIAVTLDDFGMAYSSLSRIKLLPIDRIKIDKTFIDGIGQFVKDEAIIRNIIHLARSLNQDTVAEGVEHADQVEFLRRVGCDKIQGYYYYKPMEPERVRELLQSGR